MTPEHPHTVWHATRLVREWGAAEPSELTQALARRRAAGLPVIDLVTANPHEHGLVFPPELLARLAAEALPRAAVYRPDPLGQACAREAVAGYYSALEGADADEAVRAPQSAARADEAVRAPQSGTLVEPAHVVLTPGTSMAYFHLFRLLCSAGDDVLVPRPGYPLFEDLAAAAGARVREYHLAHGTDGRWTLDLDEIAFQVTPRTRAIVVVSPHNPCGTMPTAEQWRGLGAVARRHRLAVIVDEVFCEFLGEPGERFVRPAPGDLPLAFLLNGFSKMLSLPGMKVGWIAALADPADTAAGRHLARLLEALERLSDAFLPVNEWVQAMVPALLGPEGAAVRAELAAEYARRRVVLAGALGMPHADPRAGTYLCAPLGAGVDATRWCLALLEEEGVFAHPGDLYGMPGHAVMTAVARPEMLEQGGRVVRRRLPG
jgi:aspartate/methionine/tyrosine aminotransferase